MAALGHAPLGWPLATLAGFALAAGFLVTSGSARAAGLAGWLFGIGYFAVALSWLVEPFLVFPRQDGWMAPFPIAAFACGLSVLWAAAFAAAHALGTGRASRCLVMAAGIAAAGALREVLFSGFPWALPAYVWADTPVSQSVSLFGPHMLTFLTVLASSSWVLTVRRAWIGAAAGLAGVAALWLAGEIRLGETETISPQAPVVRIVQPNIPQRRKWAPALEAAHQEYLLALTAAEADTAPDTVIWPETAATFVLDAGDARLERISAAAGGKPAVIGIRRYEGGRMFNSMAVIGPNGSIDGAYDKRHLVPFGEYLPFSEVFNSLGLTSMVGEVSGSFSPGGGGRFVEIEGVGRMLALICYEAIFPRSVRAAERAEGIIQITNDAWFGKISGPQQHFAQARMRAVESGLPLIRSSNPGISAVVDAKGRVVRSLPLGAAGFLDAPMPPALPPTVYARIGDLPLYLLVLAVAAGAGLRRIRIRH